jgi:hypothetical protein
MPPGPVGRVQDGGIAGTIEGEVVLMTWRREDSAYAAAAIAAAAVVVYFIIGNFGLVPSPLGTGRAGTRSAIAVPNLTVGSATTSSSGRQLATAVPPVPTAVRPLPAAPPTRPAVDRTPPVARITTSNGTQLSLTTPSTIDGTASDADSGIRDVTVTFTRSSGGGATTVPGHVTCTNASRRTCSWSANVPTIAGQYTVTASAVDRRGNASRPASISITVVNGGDVVSTVTNLVGGLVGAL